MSCYYPGDPNCHAVVAVDTSDEMAAEGCHMAGCPGQTQSGMHVAGSVHCRVMMQSGSYSEAGVEPAEGRGGVEGP